MAEDYLVEHGPNSLQTSPALEDLISELGLTPEVLKADPVQRNRYVVRNGRLVPLPLGPASFFSSPLFSAGAKLRLLREPFIGRGADDESVASFVRRRVGAEFLDYAIDPFVAGIHAGDPQRLSMRHAFPRMVALERNHGSLIRGMFAKKMDRSKKRHERETISFRDGLETLPNRMHQLLGERVRLKSPATALRRTDHAWSVRVNGEDEGPFDAVISTVPLHAWGSISLPQTAPELPRAQYAPVTIVWLGLEERILDHPLDGFGALVPSVEQDFEVLGTLFSSSIFPNRAPHGFALLTVFLGGTRHADADYLGSERAIDVALRDLTTLLGISGPPRFARARHWQNAIPQYDLNYADILQRLNELEHALPGVFFAGSYRDGISVADTVENAATVAERTADYIRSG